MHEMDGGSGRGAVPESGEEEETIATVVQLLQALDDRPPADMTPLFYQHGFEELNLAVRDLLRLLGHDPDIHPQGTESGFNASRSE